MRIFHAAAPLGVALVLVAPAAFAQGAPGGARAGGPSTKSPPMVLEKQQLGTTAFAMVARARMRNGDCAGALDAFDAAIAHSIDPTLRRDRGLCHEQLGHPYPAIDDYRAYLTAEPDAPDADGIRVKLAALEQSTTGKSSADDDDIPPSASAGGASASASVHIGAGGASADASASGGGGSSGPPHDSLDYVPHDNDMMKSPLRHGKGFSIAPYFAVHKWFNSGSSFGESDTWAECVGLQLRYSFGHVTTLFLEAAYQHFNTTADSTDSIYGSLQGLTSQVGLELRFPLDPDYDNQLFFAPGIGFDHLVFSTIVANSGTDSMGAIIPRARFGWRHMVDASAGIDLSLDGGAGKFALYDGDFPFGGPGQWNAMVALNVGLVWGM